ncbi:hypothetical protein A3D88_01545 [Candidatus Peribacteria bacterium RIFCSPHIGHO2_02_FULL_52_16]|nr:MAG: hypothetical protein A2706_03785 [Candidatus Peribacteria bacterium RIFCSPHIGHO2_01_FULL_51_35]OGJ61004.1 MAG: hypothetical protein A3D88_01545 [Candidatus Peribacteria bacterium RIFCSPHIGHO2_02_FULL_52_16]
MNLPPPFNWLYKAWMAFSHALGMVMSKIILTILWLTAFTIYAVCIKIGALFQKKTKPDSYWVDAQPDFKDSMKYQF